MISDIDLQRKLTDCGFTHDKYLVETADGHYMDLMREEGYESLSGQHYALPIKADSDGASDPRPGWAVIPPFGWYWVPAYWHDGGYRGTVKHPARGDMLTKQECDDLFHEMLGRIAIGDIQEAQRFELYESVHFGGQAAFDEDRAKQ